MSDDDFIKRVDVLAEIDRYRSEWDYAREAIVALPAAPTFTAADLEKLANAVWSEYQSSLEEKWTFRKEHVLNAMAADLAQRVKGPAHD